MEKESILGLLVNYMLVSLSLGLKTEKANGKAQMIIKIVVHMKENFGMIKNMDSVFLYGLVETPTKELTLKMKDTVMGR